MLTSKSSAATAKSKPCLNSGRALVGKTCSYAIFTNDMLKMATNQQALLIIATAHLKVSKLFTKTINLKTMIETRMTTIPKLKKLVASNTLRMMDPFKVKVTPTLWLLIRSCSS